MVQSFDVVLSGKGGKEEGPIALHQTAGAMQLLQLGAVSGETSIEPMQLPENSDQGCTADVKILPQEEVDRYTSRLLQDLQEVVQNLDHLMGGGEKAIQPNTASPGFVQTRDISEDVENKKGLDAKFGLIVGSVRKGVEAVIEKLEGDTDAVTKIRFA